MTIEYRRLNDSTKTEERLATLKDFTGDQFYVLDDARPYLNGIVGYYAYGAFDGDKLIAAVFGRLLDPGELSYYRRFVGDFLLDDLLNDFFDRRGGAINVFVVEPEFLTSPLLNEVVKNLHDCIIGTLEQLAEVVFVDLAAEKKNPLYEARLKNYKTLNFKKFGLIENFWLDYTTERSETECPICGNPCYCSAMVLYRRRPTQK